MKNNKNNSSVPVTVKFGPNSDIWKVNILSENTNKAGIYMWTNLTNDKRYIGSAVDLTNRLKFDYSNLAMENSFKNSKSYIYNALLKYGHYNFSLTIVEYCPPRKMYRKRIFLYVLFSAWV